MNAEEITDILGHYHLGGVREAKPFDFDQRRPWRISTDVGTFVIRERFLNACQADLAFEHGLASWLKERGFPVSQPLPTRDGRTWCQQGGRCFAIYTLIAGESYCPGDVEQSHSAGAALAEFHAIASCFPSARLKKLPEGYKTRDHYAELLMESQGDRPQVRRLVADFHSLDQELRSGPVDERLLFNDFHPENMLFVGKDFSGAFDLDLCYWGPVLLDLAKSVLAFALSIEGRQGEPSRAVLSMPCGRAFLRGYQIRRTISPEELRLLPAGLRRAARGRALYDLAEIARLYGWVEHEWQFAKSQVDMVDAECQSILASDT